MARKQLSIFLEFLREAIGARPGGDATDADLLARFARQREEAAFTAILQRHGPLVLGICRRVLGNAADAEDAFQATFLVLVRKADSIRKGGSIASWLHGVAYRVALEARGRAARRREQEKQAATVEQTGPCGDVATRELRAILDEELGQLPAKYRAPLVLHYFASKTKEETAQHLGWSEGTVSGRLARARELLRGRLTRRGVGVSSGALAAALAQEAAAVTVAPSLANSTVSLATLFAAGEIAASASTARVLALTERVVHTMFLTKLKITAAVLLVVAVVGLGAAGLYGALAEQPPGAPAIATSLPKLPNELKKIEPEGAGEDKKPRMVTLGVLVLISAKTEGMSEGAKIKQIDAPKESTGKRDISNAHVTKGRAPESATAAWPRLNGTWVRKTCTITLDDGKILENREVLFGIDFPPQALKNLRFMETCQAESDQGVGAWYAYDAADMQMPGPPAPGAVFKVPGSGTLGVALSPDGKILARAGTSPPFGPVEKTGQTIDLWDVASGKKLHTLEGHTETIITLAFSPDGKTLASSTATLRADAPNNEMKLWDVATGKERAPLGGHRKNISFGAFSPDGKTLATSGAPGHSHLARVTQTIDDPDVVRLWDMATGKEKMELGVGASLTSLAFSPDGKTLAMGVVHDKEKSASVQLWDLTTGKKRASMPGHDFGLRAVGFTPDGKTLVSLGFINEAKELNSQLTLWDVATAKERVTIPISGPAAMHVAPPLVFTADGNTLIATAWIFDKDHSNAAGVLRIRLSVQHWDLATGKARATYWTPVNPGGTAGYIGPGIWFSALSADGKTVAWGGREGTGPPYIGTAHVWEVESLATTPPDPLVPPADDAEAKAVEAITKLGGKVTRDDKLPGKPVIAVHFGHTSRSWNQVTDAGLKELKDFKQLTTLDLGNTQVTDAGLKELKALQQLTTLDLSGCIDVTDAGMKELKELKQLTSLNLRNSGPGAPRVTDAGLKELKDLKQLTSLNLDSTRVTLAGLKELKELKQLTSLNLYANQVTDAGLKELKDLRQLASLNLGGNKVTDTGLKELKELKQLTSLNLAFALVTDAGLKELKDLKQLTSLDLSTTQVTDAGLKELKELKQLTSLNLTETAVTDAGLKELKELKQLTYLDLGSTKVTDAGLKELKDLKQLTTLGLYCTAVTDAGLKELKHLKQLTSLTLAWTKVTDAGMKELKDLKELTTLHLAFTQVTDAGLKELEDVKQLTSLNLIHVKVTDDGMAALRKALPGCKIGR